MKNKILKGNLYAMMTLIIWDFTYIIGKMLLQELSPVQILTFRFVLVAILSSILNIKEYHKKSLKEEGKFVLLGFFIFLYFILENNALKLSSASNIGFIVGTVPFFSSIVAHFFTKDEKIKKSIIVGFIVSMIGVGIISFADGITIKLRGDLLMLIAVIVWCFYTLGLKKYKFAYSTYYITKKIFGYSSIFLITYMLIVKESFPNLSNITLPLLGGILYLVLIASFLGFVFWGKAIHLIGIIKTSNYLFFSPINIMILSYLFLGEAITFRKLFGGLLILMGSFILKKFSKT